MITEEEFEQFRKFYTIIRPLVIEKAKEIRQAETGRPFSSKETIMSVEYDSENNVFTVETYEDYSCGGENHFYTVFPNFMFDENAIERYKKELEQQRLAEEYRERAQAEQKRRDDELRERKQLGRLAEKYGYSLKKEI